MISNNKRVKKSKPVDRFFFSSGGVGWGGLQSLCLFLLNKSICINSISLIWGRNAVPTKLLKLGNTLESIFFFFRINCSFHSKAGTEYFRIPFNENHAYAHNKREKDEKFGERVLSV